jgi:hypothetical protein
MTIHNFEIYTLVESSPPTLTPGLIASSKSRQGLCSIGNNLDVLVGHLVDTDERNCSRITKTPPADALAFMHGEEAGVPFGPDGGPFPVSCPTVRRCPYEQSQTRLLLSVLSNGGAETAACPDGRAVSGTCTIGRWRYASRPTRKRALASLIWR